MEYRETACLAEQEASLVLKFGFYDTLGRARSSHQAKIKCKT